jgi:hypothetical protein
MYATEIEILNEQESPERGALFEEAARAYRARASVRRELGRERAAKMDEEWAAKLTARAAQLQQNRPAKNAATGRIRLVNAWTEPVSIILDGTSYSLGAGEQKELNHAAGPFTYEVPIIQQKALGEVEAGKTYTIRVRAR